MHVTRGCRFFARLRDPFFVRIVSQNKLRLYCYSATNDKTHFNPPEKKLRRQQQEIKKISSERSNETNFDPYRKKWRGKQHYTQTFSSSDDASKKKWTRQDIEEMISPFDEVKPHFNPFQKKGIYSQHQVIEPKITPKLIFTVLGNGAVGQPRCLALFTPTKGFLFNCGEGVGRFCREYEVNICGIKNVFITQRTWKNMSGVADLYVSNQVMGVKKMFLTGPPGIEGFTSMLTSYSHGMELTKREYYEDDNFRIDCVPIHNRPSIGGERDVCFSYVCKIRPFAGELNTEKCVDLNVPIGSHLLQLKNGEDVVLSSGRIVHAADVLDTPQPATTALIVDCPSDDFLDPFVECEEFSLHQVPEDECGITQVFHFSPPNIINSSKYSQWMQKFHKNTEHFILNSSNPYTGSEAIYQIQSFLHTFHPEIFKLLPAEESQSSSAFTSPNSIVHAPPMLQIQIRPERKIHLDNVIEKPAYDWMTALNDVADFKGEMDKFQSLLNTTTTSQSAKAPFDSDFPEVVFLGTSSATSTAFRNVSGILVKLNDSKSIVLDCGEGTYMQMVRYFGKLDVMNELRNISAIFISHKHTDHYLGVFSLIKARVEAFENCGLTYRTLAVIVPRQVKDVFYMHYEIFEEYKYKIRIFPCKRLIHPEHKVDMIYDLLGGIKLQTVPVFHCYDAYGVILEKESEWKIVYSGDTAPCQKLIDAGENCSLLIHEASMEDNYLSEATLKKHCTTSQVLDIAESMKAQYTIMTHFSKRYLAAPVFQDRETLNVGFAFDFMKVRFRDLPLIKQFVPIFKTIFQDQMDDHLEKSSNIAQFENIFLEVFKTNKYR